MQKAWTIRLALALIFAAVLDILSTYLVTPDLSLEGNPVFVMLGRKWIYIITFKIILSLFAILAFAKGLKILQNRVDRFIGITGLVNVLSYLIFNRRVSLKEFLFYRLPKDWPSVFAIGAITIGISITTGGLTAAILNTFKIIQSTAQVIAFFLGNAILVLGIALWLTYQFVVKQQKAKRDAEGKASTC